MKKGLALLLVLSLFSKDVQAAYSFYRSVTIDHTKVPNTDQASFPMLVCANGSAPCNTSISGLNQSGAGAHVQNSSGFDIGFFTDNTCTTKVTAWEVEKYVASTGEIEVWVNDGTVSHTADTVLYLCYGNSSISTFQSTASSVWDSSYKIVYHLADNAANTTVTDSTSNGNNGTNAANTSGKSAAAKISNGLVFNGTSDTVTGPSLTVNDTDKFTMEAWVNLSGNGNFPMVWSFSPLSTNELRYNGSARTPQFTISATSITGGTALAQSTWHQLVGVFDGTNMNLYVDGSLVAGPTAGSPLGGTANIYLASRAASLFLPGTVDEARFSNGTTATAARSADWIATDYNNQNSPSTFVTFGTETAGGATTPAASKMKKLMKLEVL